MISIDPHTVYTFDLNTTQKIKDTKTKLEVGDDLQTLITFFVSNIVTYYKGITSFLF